MRRRACISSCSGWRTRRALRLIGVRRPPSGPRQRRLKSADHWVNSRAIAAPGEDAPVHTGGSATVATVVALRAHLQWRLGQSQPKLSTAGGCFCERLSRSTAAIDDRHGAVDLCRPIRASIMVTVCTARSGRCSTRRRPASWTSRSRRSRRIAADRSITSVAGFANGGADKLAPIRSTRCSPSRSKRYPHLRDGAAAQT